MDVILITGCSGRIGKAVMQKLGNNGFAVVGFDIVAPTLTPKNFEFINVDLTSDISVSNAMGYVKKKYGPRIVSIIHLAAYYNFTGGAWELYEKLTIQGSKRLLFAAKNFETEQFLFSSSMLVHAPCEPGQKITEQSPLIENWEYPKSKVLAEKMFKENHGDIPLVILRIAGCYDDACHSIPISNQIQRIYEHQITGRLFPGDLTHGAPFLHLEDLADCIFECVKKRSQLPKEAVFLVGEEETLSYDELQKMISKQLTGKPMKTFCVPKWFAKFGAWAQNKLPFMPKTFIKPWMIDIADSHYELDMSYTEKTLGWKPKHSLREALPIMLKTLRMDPVKWYRDNDLQMPSKKTSCCGKGSSL